MTESSELTLSKLIAQKTKKMELLATVEDEYDMPEEYHIDFDDVEPYTPHTPFDKPFRIAGTINFLEQNIHHIEFPVEPQAMSLNDVIEDIASWENKLDMRAFESSEAIEVLGCSGAHLIISLTEGWGSMKFALPYAGWMDHKNQTLATRNFFGMVNVPLDYSLRSAEDVSKMNLNHHLRGYFKPQSSGAIVFDQNSLKEYHFVDSDEKVIHVKAFEVLNLVKIGQKGKTQIRNSALIRKLFDEVRKTNNGNSDAVLVPIRYLPPEIAASTSGDVTLRLAVVPKSGESMRSFSHSQTEEFGTLYPGLTVTISDFFDPYRVNVSVRPTLVQKSTGNSFALPESLMNTGTGGSLLLASPLKKLSCCMGIIAKETELDDGSLDLEIVHREMSKYADSSVEKFSASQYGEPSVKMKRMAIALTAPKGFGTKKVPLSLDHIRPITWFLQSICSCLDTGYSQIKLWGYADVFNVKYLSETDHFGLGGLSDIMTRILKLPKKVVDVVLFELVADKVQKTGKYDKFGDLAELMVKTSRAFDQKIQDKVEAQILILVSELLRHKDGKGVGQPPLYEVISSKLKLELPKAVEA